MNRSGPEQFSGHHRRQPALARTVSDHVPNGQAQQSPSEDSPPRAGRTRPPRAVAGRRTDRRPPRDGPACGGGRPAMRLRPVTGNTAQAENVEAGQPRRFSSKRVVSRRFQFGHRSGIGAIEHCRRSSKGTGATATPFQSRDRGRRPPGETGSRTAKPSPERVLLGDRPSATCGRPSEQGPRTRRSRPLQARRLGRRRAGIVDEGTAPCGHEGSRATRQGLGHSGPSAPGSFAAFLPQRNGFLYSVSGARR